MIRSLHKLAGAAIHAVDGDLGRVSDFYFDDETWTVRYLVVEAGNWLTGRVVLISPLSVNRVEWDRNRVDVSLTRDQVRNSPDIDTAEPVARREEARLFRYYGWPSYWSGAGLWGPWLAPTMTGAPAFTLPSGEADAKPPAENIDGESHLRSMREVLGYSLRAGNEDAGQLADLLIQVLNWSIQYLVIHAGELLHSRTVALRPGQVARIDWDKRLLVTNVDPAAIDASPDFDPAHVDDSGPWDKAEPGS